MRKLRKIHLHQEGTHQLTVGFFVWFAINALTYYLTYPELRWLFILIAVFTTIFHPHDLGQQSNSAFQNELP